jgi:hypothetical protein
MDNYFYIKIAIFINLMILLKTYQLKYDYEGKLIYEKNSFNKYRIFFILVWIKHKRLRI